MTVKRTVFHKTNKGSFDETEDRWTFVDDGLNRYVLHERTTGNFV